ncbi:hypothetical protein FRC04_012069 [Tulasnella sp. 424]|nr:hypothetical protein FRC04_012069 [Tulasnella sp. 424]
MSNKDYYNSGAPPQGNWGPPQGGPQGYPPNQGGDAHLAGYGGPPNQGGYYPNQPQQAYYPQGGYGQQPYQPQPQPVYIQQQQKDSGAGGGTCMAWRVSAAALKIFVTASSKALF